MAVGTTLDKVNAHYVTKLPNGYDSCKGVGLMEPDEKQAITVKSVQDGVDVKVPTGKLIDTHGVSKSELRYHEYIVYNLNQLKMKYLLKVQFNYV